MKVTVISRGDHASVIQFVKDGKTTRAMIPNTEIKDRHVEEASLAAAPEIGFPFDTALTAVISELDAEALGDKFRYELNNLSIFEIADVEARKLEVKAVLGQVLNVVFSSVYSRMKQLQRESANEQQSQS